MLEEHLKNASVMFVHNERFARTKMFDSVKLGLEALDAACEKILLTPCGKIHTGGVSCGIMVKQETVNLKI